MKIVTWNVNSLAVRLPRVVEFVGLHEPDIVCLQETKCEAAAFPVEELAAAGYRGVQHSAGRWAGVAILARDDRSLTAGASGLAGEVRTEEARWVEATVDGLRVASAYVPNGRALDTPTFAEKLAFFDAMQARVAELRAAGEQIVVTGDLNVTRDDRDVWDPAAFVGSTHVTPDERARLEGVLEAGDLVDAYRDVHPDDQQFTWWDYRQGHFHRGMGLRIDYILVSRSLAGRIGQAGIERDFRKGTKPSDHAPLVAVLD
ncbi:MAG TPA: exodeoxyribonuclease III [Solirubrobacteraceae bacterium]|jgi:exodeoxyribonuclease-3|nr:exodeoxyribonuclease III [Solirubrobacteraceae bacterium]